MSCINVLIADDEVRMRKLVADFLKKEGYRVLEAEDGNKALDIFYGDQKLDIIILDLMMPGLDGWSVCKEIRKNNSLIPIVMLTARSQETDELLGFELGADEYITKPFSPMLLVARVQALLRRSGSGKKTVKMFDRLEIDEIGYVVRIDGEPTDLTSKEFEVLLHLANNKEIVITREQLLEAVWRYNYIGETRVVDQCIKRIRAKLGTMEYCIQTIRGMGYKFEVKK